MFTHFPADSCFPTDSYLAIKSGKLTLHICIHLQKLNYLTYSQSFFKTIWHIFRIYVRMKLSHHVSLIVGWETHVKRMAQYHI